jgi:hypothetical protein
MTKSRMENAVRTAAIAALMLALAGMYSQSAPWEVVDLES